MSHYVVKRRRVSKFRKKHILPIDEEALYFKFHGPMSKTAKFGTSIEISYYRHRKKIRKKHLHRNSRSLDKKTVLFVLDTAVCRQLA